MTSEWNKKSDQEIVQSLKELMYESVKESEWAALETPEDAEPLGLREDIEYGQEKYVYADAGIFLEESYGGEGQGEAYWFVLRIGDRYFKFDGYYMSYDGAYIEWDDMVEVEPREVVRKEWFKI